MKPFSPIIPKFPHILHGADYNPDQWQDRPEVLEEDMRLMKEAGCNIMSIGIFSWAMLEPEDGVYDFSYLDKTMDMLADNGIYACLATPSGARPAWMSKAYPEVLRVDGNGIRNLHGGRHNHCLTSPVYRRKVREMNTRLAQRYKDHPALAVWHISNEYSGECRCEYCVSAFRDYLKDRYKTLDNLNKEWWTNFWSHTYTDWEQIDPPSPRGEGSINGLMLDWRRFVTAQTVDFMKNEIAPMREITPDIPLTTNMMGTFMDLDSSKFSEINDRFSWDSYPTWHDGNPALPASTAFVHDLMRSLGGGKPFMLMESTPSKVNWMPVNKLKKPGMHKLASLQAVAHGADTVQYFQWRKGRGGTEKYHGAVVDHCGGGDTRVFRDVAELGETLKKMDEIVGTEVRAQVGIVYDWENRWAVSEIQGLKSNKKSLDSPSMRFYLPFWKHGVSVDILQMTDDFSKYKLLILPMLYMLKDGVAENIRKFVENGGTVITTYMSGQVNENDLCYTGGFPGNGLMDVFGIWAEEMDSLYDHERNHVVMGDKTYEAEDYCELIHARGAKVLAEYADDFYKGMPALTCNDFGKGRAYYIAFRDANAKLCDDLCTELIKELSLPQSLGCRLPEGVEAQMRSDDERDYIFVGNYNDTPVCIDLPENVYTDLFDGSAVSGKTELPPFGIRIITRKTCKSE